MLIRMFIALAAGVLLAGSTVVLDDLGPPIAAGEEGIGYGEASIQLQSQPGVATDPTVTIVSSPDWSEQRGRLWLVDPSAEQEGAPPLGSPIAQGPAAGVRLGRTLAAGDFNGDGYTDLVAGGTLDTSGTLYALWGGLDGWSEPELFHENGFPKLDGESLSVGDLDGDGLDDLVAASGDYVAGVGRLLFFYGDTALSPGHPQPWFGTELDITKVDGGVGAMVEAGVDWNCDGHPDLVTGDVNGTLIVLLNELDPDGQPLGWKESDAFALLDLTAVMLPGLSSASASVHALGNVTGDSQGCSDLLLVSEDAEQGRGELLLIEGRATDDWLALGESPALADVARVRRRGGAPWQGLGASALPVWWSQPGGPGEGRLPDLLLGAPEGHGSDDASDLPGLTLFLFAKDLWGPSGEAPAADAYGSEPADHPSLAELAAVTFEGGWPGWQTGSSLGLQDDRDGDDLPDLLVGAIGWRSDPHAPDPRGALFGIGSGLFVDDDGDGSIAVLDCDDEDPERTPGAPELCDDKDNDCDGDTHWQEQDLDGDGVAECEGDCNDLEAGIHPGAVDVCGGVDEDCDGLMIPEETDDDGDGFSECDGDCDDGDPTRYRGAPPTGAYADTDCDDVADWPGGWSCRVTGARIGGAGVLAALTMLLIALGTRRQRL